MFIGQTILSSQSGFTPWMPRQADNAVLTWEKIQEMFTTVDVEVYHKNTEESGEGVLVDSNDPVTGTWANEGALYYGTFNGLKEMVRFRIFTTATSGAAIYRLLEPTWFDDAITP